MTYDQELSKIEHWMNNSDEPWDDWDWDGTILTVFGERTEKYDRQDLEEAHVF